MDDFDVDRELRGLLEDDDQIDENAGDAPNLNVPGAEIIDENAVAEGNEQGNVENVQAENLDVDQALTSTEELESIEAGRRDM